MESNQPEKKSHFESATPLPGCPPSRPRLDPEGLGRTTAVFHGNAHWNPTSDYLQDRIHILDQAARRLQLLLPRFSSPTSGQLLQSQFAEARRVLNNGFPSKLPFLPTNGHSRPRLRIAAAVREWLLTARHPRRLEHLHTFLIAYQGVYPLHLSELRLIPTALQMAVAEKCSMLPSEDELHHMEFLPGLVQDLSLTCQLITETNWNRFIENLHSSTPEPVGNHRPHLARSTR